MLVGEDEDGHLHNDDRGQHDDDKLHGHFFPITVWIYLILSLAISSSW